MTMHLITRCLCLSLSYVAIIMKGCWFEWLLLALDFKVIQDVANKIFISANCFKIWCLAIKLSRVEIYQYVSKSVWKLFTLKELKVVAELAYSNVTEKSAKISVLIYNRATGKFILNGKNQKTLTCQVKMLCCRISTLHTYFNWPCTFNAISFIRNIVKLCTVVA